MAARRPLGDGRGVSQMQRDRRPAPEPESRAAARPDAAPLRAVELLAVALVWTFYGVLNVANEVLDRHPGGHPSGAEAGLEARLFVHPAVWAVLTTLVLWVGRRVSL